MAIEIPINTYYGVVNAVFAYLFVITGSLAFIGGGAGIVLFCTDSTKRQGYNFFTAIFALVFGAMIVTLGLTLLGAIRFV